MVSPTAYASDLKIQGSLIEFSLKIQGKLFFLYQSVLLELPRIPRQLPHIEIFVGAIPAGRPVAVNDLLQFTNKSKTKAGEPTASPLQNQTLPSGSITLATALPHFLQAVFLQPTVRLFRLGG